MMAFDPFWQLRNQYLKRCAEVYERTHRYDDCPNCASHRAKLVELREVAERLRDLHKIMTRTPVTHKERVTVDLRMHALRLHKKSTV